MTRLTNIIWPAIILAGSISLLQLHAIQFWTAQVGPAGWAWSILLEVVALWLWYQRSNAKRVLGLLASILTLLGPVYDVAEPIIEDVTAAQYSDTGRESLIQSLSAEQHRLEESIATFRKNSQARTGWLAPIQKSEQRLVEIGKELAQLKQTTPGSEGTLRSQGIIIMQVAALFLFQITAVLAITTISRKENAATEGNEPEADASDPDSVPYEDNSLIRVHADSLPEHHPQDEISTLMECNQSPPAADPQSSQENHALNVTPLIPVPQESPIQGNEGDENRRLDRGKFSYRVILGIRDEMLQHLAYTKKTQSEFAEQARVSPRDIVFLKKHEILAQEGKRTISEESLTKIQNTLPAS